jgi:hypothetical protein
MSTIQPLPNFQTDPSMQFSGLRMPVMAHGPPNMSLAPGPSNMMIPTVPRPMEQHATGMRLPYITPQAPVIDAQHRIVFSQPNQPHMPPNVSLPNHHQPSNHHRFSMFNSAAPRATQSSSGTGMSIPLQVPTNVPNVSVPMNASNGMPPAQNDIRASIGMRLPIVIQPEVPAPQDVIMDQEQPRVQNTHMRLPTMTTPEPVLPSHSTAATNGYRSASPPDIKPDISKIDLHLSKRRPLQYEKIQIDQEEDAPDTASVTYVQYITVNCYVCFNHMFKE